jgi:signal peptidase I
MTNLLLYGLAIFIFIYLIYESYRDGGFIEAIKFTIIFSFLFVSIRYFLIQPFLVDGPSMSPTFETGNYLLVEKLSYILGEPKRGDVVIFDEPERGLDLSGQKKICYISNFLTKDESDCLWSSKRYLVKRLIGLPGDKVVVLNGVTTIYNTENPNGKLLDEKYVIHSDPRSAEITLGSDEYFVMGDNRAGSSDSRIWGPIHKDALVGTPLIRLLPIKSIDFAPGKAALEQ